MNADAPAWLAPLAEGCTGGAFHAMLPDRRPTADPAPGDRPHRDSAVLVLFGGDPDAPGPHPPADASVLLTHRAPTLRSHSGQVAFPGGRADEGDDGPVGTALREAVEETGLDPAGVEPLAVSDPLFIPASHYFVHPVLSYWRRPGVVGVVDTAEVARVMTVPLTDLLDPGNRFVIAHGDHWRGPAFHLDDLVLWGFTAGVLSAMFEVAGWELEWDRDDVRDLQTTLEASGNGERTWMPTGRQERS